MILKALADYYQRLVDDPEAQIAPLGFEKKAIDFVIDINEQGEFEGLRDIREGTGNRRKGRPSLVPKGVKRSSNVASNLLWDTAPYVLGKVLPEKGKDLEKLAARAIEQHAHFVANIEKTFKDCPDEGIEAVRSFLKNANFEPVFNHATWKAVEEKGGNITFALSNERRQLICQRKEVVAAILKNESPASGTQVCVLCGDQDAPAKLHTAIKGVWGAQSSGANIVSFNLDAFRSFGKKQGANAPVGQTTEFAYTTALNYLLASDKQRMQVGDASTVFWAQNPCDFESDFHTLLAPPKGEETVSYDKIRGLLSAVKTGIPPTEAEIPFYVLGLAPNASRIAIRFWHEGNVKEIKERTAQHFEDLKMVRASYDPEFLSLFQLLVSTATEHKSDNIPPNLGGELARAVLAGTGYPRTLFANAIRRCKAEQRVGFARASIIKAFLVRNARISKSQRKEVSMALDTSYDNIGYVLGRLFAVLEKIQEQAQGKGLNKTIRDTYFGAATSSPQATFNRLGQLSIHHLSKIRNSGKSTVWLDKLLGEVNNLLPKEGYPSILRLEDQGRFIVGYHHQHQDFFKTKNTEDKGDEA